MLCRPATPVNAGTSQRTYPRPHRWPFRCRLPRGLLMGVLTEQRYPPGRAYRDGRLVCWRVHVTIGRDDTRLGLAPRERRFVTASFGERLDSALHAELVQLARRRGAAARRIAESMEPVVMVVDDPVSGCRHRMVARLQPRQVRGSGLSEIEFGVRRSCQRRDRRANASPLARRAARAEVHRTPPARPLGEDAPATPPAGSAHQPRARHPRS
jgi:hypothetical protein